MAVAQQPGTRQLPAYTDVIASSSRTTTPTSAASGPATSGRASPRSSAAITPQNGLAPLVTGKFDGLLGLAMRHGRGVDGFGGSITAAWRASTRNAAGGPVNARHVAWQRYRPGPWHAVVFLWFSFC